MNNYDKLQLEMEAHRKTWRQLEQVQRENAALKNLIDRTNERMEELAHELWAAAQLAPGEGISDAVARMNSLRAEEQLDSYRSACETATHSLANAM